MAEYLGNPWDHNDEVRWFDEQKIQRFYKDLVLDRLNLASENSGLVTEKYGALPYDPEHYPLYALRSKRFDKNRPTVLITGGVHGDELSGVTGTLQFLIDQANDWTGLFNFVALPCISPWGFETVNRWNPSAQNPYVEFFLETSCKEAFLAMAYVGRLAHENGVKINLHLDLHETTYLDRDKFQPEYAAKLGLRLPELMIPTGFHLVGVKGREKQFLEDAIIDSVRDMTDIATPDERGKIMSKDMEREGVVYCSAMNICSRFTGAASRLGAMTTEVLRASPHTNDEHCDAVQIAAIAGALSHVKAQLKL